MDDSGLLKINGLKLLQKYNLPILPYKVLSKENFQKEIKDFLAQNHLREFMVRTDGRGKFSPSINNATLPKNLAEIEKLFRDGFVVMAMHPGNIYRNFHSLNILRNDSEIIVEIVGPGFNSLDLNRAGKLHETIKLDLEDYHVLSKEIIEPNEYHLELKNKIGQVDLTELKTNKSYLLEYPNYVPLDKRELLFIKESLPKLKAIGKELESENFIASLVFLDLGDKLPRPVFWDIYGIE